MRFLKHLLAILLGITLLPLRVLAYNVVYAASVVTIAIGISIRLSFSSAVQLNRIGIPIVINILLTSLIIFPLVATVSVIALAGVVGYIVYNTIIHMLQSAWLGFKNGLLYEMNGFWNALDSRQTLWDHEIPVQLRGTRAGFSAQEPIDDVDFDGFQRIRGELQDVVVVRQDLEVPDMENKAPQAVAALLSGVELEQIGKLIEQFVAFKEPLSLGKKKKLDALKILWTQYNDLSQKLEGVRCALVSNDKSRIHDELIAFNEVETPILLVKQYKKEERWFNVPAASYVTDKESLLTWLKQNCRHPLNKDLLKNPEPYNEMKARYMWYELTVKDCSSQELGEAAEQIRALANGLANEQRVALGVRSAFQRFFDIAPVASTSLAQNELSPSQYSP